MNVVISIMFFIQMSQAERNLLKISSKDAVVYGTLISRQIAYLYTTKLDTIHICIMKERFFLICENMEY